jgi:hypothetical protein
VFVAVFCPQLNHGTTRPPELAPYYVKIGHMAKIEGNVDFGNRCFYEVGVMEVEEYF